MLRGMTVRARHLLSLFLAAGLGACASAQADSLASSASSAGSASSGSVSDSFHGSSRSSSGDEKRADVDYQVLDVGVVPERDGVARLALRARNSAEVVYLDLPRDIPARHHIVAGDLVHAQHEVYGLAFARADQREPFYLVLQDDWHDGLAARPVTR